jgi:tetratricopeptide (TPR) repeat protein
MIIKVSELEDGVRMWFNCALKLLYVNTMPALPGSPEMLMEPAYWEAKLALDIVIHERPRWAEAYYHRGVAFAALTEGVWVSPMTGRALQDFGTALSLDPNFAEAYQARAALYSQQRPQRAIADLGSLITIQPTVDTYLKRASLLRWQGEYAAAVADYREALKRYTSYCGVVERQQVEGYMDRVSLELQNGNLQGVLNSLIMFWEQHSFMSYQ